MTHRPFTENSIRESNEKSQKAETNLADGVRAIDVSNAYACSPRANAFRTMQENWNTWNDDDDRWWAVWDILSTHDTPGDDHETLRRGIAACTSSAEIIGGTRLGCAIDGQTVDALELQIAELAAVAARLRVATYVDDSDDARYAEVLNG